MMSDQYEHTQIPDAHLDAEHAAEADTLTREGSEPTLEDLTEAQALSLARAFQAHPAYRRALEACTERQQQRREAANPKGPEILCPHCKAPGITYLTIQTASGPREFKRRPMDCCQPALADAAENDLRYAFNPNNKDDARVEAADRYAALRESITRPDLIERLAMKEAELADIDQRIFGLTRPQGGVDK